MPYPANVYAYTILNYNLTQVSSGSGGVNAADAISAGATSMGIALSAGDLAYFTAAASQHNFTTSSGYIAAGIGIMGNIYEIFDTRPDTAAERLEDIAQIITSVIILGIGGPGGAILNGIILGPWEIWELKRNN